MSYQLLKQDVLFYQRMLKSNGYYPYKLDGLWGPKTDAGDKAFVKETEDIRDQYGSFDSRSESCITTLAPKTQKLCRQFLKLVLGQRIDARVLSGTRTYAEQNTLYRKGRYSTPGPKVTNARGGQSNHNFGLAWDIGIFDNGKYVSNTTPYKEAALLVLDTLSNLEWGGNWISFKDYPHYQHSAFSSSVTQVRERFETGKAYLA